MAESRNGRALGRTIADLEKRIRSLERMRRLRNSTIENASIEVRDEDGELRQVIGVQPDGSVTTVDHNGYPPPTPGVFSILPAPQGLVIDYTGEAADGAVWPADFRRVEVHISLLAGFTPTHETHAASYFNTKGGRLTIGGLLPGERYYVVLVAENTSGVEGIPTEAQVGIPAALSTTFGENTQYFNLSTDPPTPPANGFQVNDTWQQPDYGYRLLRWDGNDWVLVQYGADAIANDAITDAHITEGAIGNTHLGPDAVDVRNIVDGAIGTEKLADFAVDLSKMGTGSVGIDQLIENAVTEHAIADLAITAPKIDDKAITEGKIAESAVTTAKIAEAAVGSVALANEAVSSEKLAEAAVLSSKIAEAAVEAAKIATGAVTEAKIGAGAVVADKIKNGAVTAAKLNVTFGGTNLLANASFEDSTPGTMPAGWERAGAHSALSAAASQDRAFEGTRSLRLDATSAASMYVRHLVPAPLPATKYTFSAWVWVESIRGASAANRALFCYDPVRHTDGSHTALAIDTTMTITHPTGKWVRHQATYTTSANPGPNLELRLYCPVGTAYWDAVQLETGDVASSFSPAAGEILPGRITTDLLASDAVTADKLADAAVYAPHLAEHAVETDAIRPGAIITDRLGPGAVVTEKLAENAVTSKILAAHAVNTAHVAPEAITSAELGLEAVTTAKLGPGAVIAEKLAEHAVTTDALAPQAVSTAKIAPDAVTGVQIAAEAITTTKIAPAAITTTLIAESAVGEEQLATQAVTAAKLAPGSVTSGAIADFAIPAMKLVSRKHAIY